MRGEEGYQVGKKLFCPDEWGPLISWRRPTYPEIEFLKPSWMPRKTSLGARTRKKE